MHGIEDIHVALWRAGDGGNLLRWTGLFRCRFVFAFAMSAACLRARGLAAHRHAFERIEQIHGDDREREPDTKYDE
jgi:hypothetical protein